MHVSLAHVAAMLLLPGGAGRGRVRSFSASTVVRRPFLETGRAFFLPHRMNLGSTHIVPLPLDPATGKVVARPTTKGERMKRRISSAIAAACMLFGGIAAVSTVTVTHEVATDAQAAEAHSSHGVWYPGCHGTQWKAIDGYGNHLAYEYEVPGGTGGHPQWSPRYYWLGYNGYFHGDWHSASWATRRIMDAYAWEGWECGRLGVPTSDPNYQWWNSAWGYVWMQSFSQGYVVYKVNNGDVCVLGSWSGWAAECGY